MTARRARWMMAILFALMWGITVAVWEWLFDIEQSGSIRALTIRIVFALALGWFVTSARFHRGPPLARMRAEDRREVIYATLAGRRPPVGLEQEVIGYARFLQDEANGIDRIRWYHWLAPAGLVVAGATFAAADGLGGKSATVWATAVLAAILVILRPRQVRRPAARAHRAEVLASEMLLR